MKKSIATLFLLLFSATQLLLGQSFTAQLKNGGQLYFSVTDTLKKTVEVSKVKALVEMTSSLKGNLDIPQSVVYKNVTYQVASIREKAFSGLGEITSVSIPSSISEIGAFAFEGCTSLEGIVFPSQEPTFGKGVFDGCTSIRNISIGGDWQTIDCSLFAASTSLESLYIPARVKSITNLKALKALNSLVIDQNNAYFLSIENLLYSKDGKMLFACPVGITGKIDVPIGTEEVFDGAFDGCEQITEVSLPQTIHSFSYLSFVQCINLTTIRIFAEVPPITARWNGAAVFAIQHPNASVILEVPSNLLNLYQLSACNKPGEYETMNGAHKQVFTDEGFINKERIKKCKK